MLKRALELDGWSVWADDEWNWMLGRHYEETPITIPKLGPLVPIESLENALSKASLSDGRFLELKDQAILELGKETPFDGESLPN